MLAPVRAGRVSGLRFVALFSMAVNLLSRLEGRAIAGVFAFLAEARRGEPYERVEPVDRAQALGHDLCRPVAPRDVRELVKEDDANPIVGPAAGASRQDDVGLEDAPRDE